MYYKCVALDSTILYTEVLFVFATVTTFWEIAARSVSNCSHCILSICNIYLFFRFGFKSGIGLLIASVPAYCFFYYFQYQKH